jgi:hypothetical protein
VFEARRSRAASVAAAAARHTADIAPGRIEGDLAPTPEGFWAAELPSRTLQVWDHLNGLGRDCYATHFRPLLDRATRIQPRDDTTPNLLLQPTLASGRG